VLETQAGAQAKADAAQTAAEQTAASDATTQITAHNDATTNVHGIADTSVLETQAGAQAKADAAQTAAEATAAATYISAAEKASSDGVATLDANGVVPEAQLPDDLGGAAFRGDWQAGETYEPGDIVASDGYLMTPNVTTTESPYALNPFSGNLTNADWIKIPDPNYPNTLATGNNGAMDYIVALGYHTGANPGWSQWHSITHNEVLGDIDGLSIEFTAADIGD
jgi:hypothetical protein